MAHVETRNRSDGSSRRVVRLDRDRERGRDSRGRDDARRGARLKSDAPTWKHDLADEGARNDSSDRFQGRAGATRNGNARSRGGRGGAHGGRGGARGNFTERRRRFQGSEDGEVLIQSGNKRAADIPEPEKRPRNELADDSKDRAKRMLGGLLFGTLRKAKEQVQTSAVVAKQQEVVAEIERKEAEERAKRLADKEARIAQELAEFEQRRLRLKAEALKSSSRADVLFNKTSTTPVLYWKEASSASAARKTDDNEESADEKDESDVEDKEAAALDAVAEVVGDA